MGGGRGGILSLISVTSHTTFQDTQKPPLVNVLLTGRAVFLLYWDTRV